MHLAWFGSRSLVHVVFARPAYGGLVLRVALSRHLVRCVWTLTTVAVDGLRNSVQLWYCGIYAVTVFLLLKCPVGIAFICVVVELVSGVLWCGGLRSCRRVASTYQVMGRFRPIGSKNSPSGSVVCGVRED